MSDVRCQKPGLSRRVFLLGSAAIALAGPVATVIKPAASGKTLLNENVLLVKLEPPTWTDVIIDLPEPVPAMNSYHAMIRQMAHAMAVPPELLKQDFDSISYRAALQETSRP